MNIKHIAFSLFAMFALSMTARPVFADGSCTNQYGSTVECPTDHIEINKKVAYPTNKSFFVENITSADTAYAPGDEVEYDIAVTNTSNTNYQTVTVIDTFPGVVTFMSGPGRYEQNGNKLTYEISNLGAGETVHNRVLVQLDGIASFPQDLTCEIENTVRVTGPNGMSDSDTADLCVQTKVMGATTLPVAGFDDWAYALPFIALAVAGVGILGKGAFRP